MEEREQVLHLAFCGGALGAHNIYLRQYGRAVFKVMLTLLAFKTSILLGAGTMSVLNMFSGAYVLARY